MSRDADVLVIGAGPVGLLIANLLGRRGLSVIVLEKQTAAYGLPRAIHFDGEAMRCFQAAGLALDILSHTHVGKGMLFKDGSGRTLVDWSRDQEPGPMGWYESYRFHQPGLEWELRRGVDRFADVTLRTGAEVVAVSDTSSAVEVTCANGETVTGSYLVGCDGAASFLRSHLGIGLEDLGFEERWLVVDLILNEPRADFGDHSIQYCDPDYPATYVRGVGARRRWEMRLHPDDPDTLTDADVWQRLARWITPAAAQLERSAVYTFRSRIAETWRAGRCLLAGDAAHQMPPFMGQGMCAGVRDAANLAWKLAAVLRGADDDLLDSYETERAPNVRAFIELSVALGRLINQTAAGEVPKGRMRSIWPDLGPGLGARDGVGGTLVPQVRDAEGRLAEDGTRQGFYVLAREACDAGGLPMVTGAEDWLAEKGVAGVVVRPDGYALGGFSDDAGLRALVQEARQLDPR